MIYIGIDPGLFGSVGVITDYSAAVFDTPTTKIKKGKTTKNQYLPSEMASILLRFKGDDVHVVIEAIHAMPKQGVTSSFNFGVGYGLWLGILAAYEIPHTKVTPQAWKKEIMKGCTDKDASRIRAAELFPGLSSQFAKKKDDGRAESMLMAQYCRNLFNKKD
jgi:crossover junction endodeoxyribonuclease RuvC